MSTSVRVIVVGILGALLFFSLLRALLYYNASPYTASVFTYLVCFCVVYIAQRKWSFRRQSQSRGTFYRYGAVQLTCLIVSALLTKFFVSINLDNTFLSFLVTFITSGLSFLGTRFWAFK